MHPRALLVSLIITFASLGFATGLTWVAAEISVSDVLRGFYDGYRLTTWDYRGGLLAFAFDRHVYLVDVVADRIIFNVSLSSMVYSLRLVDLGELYLLIGYGPTLFVRCYEYYSVWYYRPSPTYRFRESSGFAALRVSDLSLRLYRLNAPPVDFIYKYGILFVCLTNGYVHMYDRSFSKLGKFRVLDYSVEGVFVRYHIYELNDSYEYRYVVISSVLRDMYAYAAWFYLCPPPDGFRTCTYVSFLDDSFALKEKLHLEYIVDGLFSGLSYWHIGFAFSAELRADGIYIPSECSVFRVFYNDTAGRWEKNTYGVFHFFVPHASYSYVEPYDADGDGELEYLYVYYNGILDLSTEVAVWDDGNLEKLFISSGRVYAVQFINNTKLAVVYTSSSIEIGEIANGSLRIISSAPNPLGEHHWKYLWLLPYAPPAGLYHVSEDEAVIICSGPWGLMYCKLDIGNPNTMAELLRARRFVFRCIPNLYYRYGYPAPPILYADGTNHISLNQRDNYILYRNETVRYEYEWSSFVQGAIKYDLSVVNDSVTLIRTDLIENRSAIALSLVSAWDSNIYEVEWFVATEEFLDSDRSKDTIFLASLITLYDGYESMIFIALNLTAGGLRCYYKNISEEDWEISYWPIPLSAEALYDGASITLLVTGLYYIARVILNQTHIVDVRCYEALGSGCYNPGGARSYNVYVGEEYVVLSNYLCGTEHYRCVVVFDKANDRVLKFKKAKDFSYGDHVVSVVTREGVHIVGEEEVFIDEPYAISTDIHGGTVFLLTANNEIENTKTGERITLRVDDFKPRKIRFVPGSPTPKLLVFSSSISTTKISVLDLRTKKNLTSLTIDETYLAVVSSGERIFLITRDRIYDVKTRIYGLEAYIFGSSQVLLLCVSGAMVASGILAVYATRRKKPHRDGKNAHEPASKTSPQGW